MHSFPGWIEREDPGNEVGMSLVGKQYHGYNSSQVPLTCSKRGKNRAYKVQLVSVSFSLAKKQAQDF